MDERSVAAHFAVVPEVRGQLTWATPKQLVFEHAPLRPGTAYEVVLTPGYRDAAGTVNSLRHHWPFRTEEAPVLTGSSPGAGDQSADPAAYLTLTFTRPMDLSTLGSAVSLSPVAGFAVRADPGDPRRVVLAPRSLLDPDRDYTIAVTRDARDIDGNPLGAGTLVSFHTGPLRPLQHWTTFITVPSGPAAAVGPGIWVANENRFPRLLYSGSVRDFRWSASGTRMLIREESGSWGDWTITGALTPLGFQARWADYLSPELGYAYQLRDKLMQLTPSGRTIELASGVTQAAVAPGGTRIAYVVDTRQGSELRAIEVPLRAGYRLQAEPAQISDLSWAPDSSAVAYRVATGDPSRWQLRVRQLTGDGAVLTLAAGDLVGPSWQDRRHLIFTGVVQSPAGPITKAFRRSLSDTAASPLELGAGLPAGIQPASSVRASPDGRQISFLSDAAGGSQVWLMNADGTGLSELTRYDESDFPYSCRTLAWTLG